MKTLRISDETHRELTKIGSYEETMDDIIKKLLRHWKSQQYKSNHVSLSRGNKIRVSGADLGMGSNGVDVYDIIMA